jgi:hypothetical protein
MTNEEFFREIKQKAETAYNKKAALGPDIVLPMKRSIVLKAFPDQ